LESDFNEFIGVNVYKGDDTDPDTGVEQDE